jgi:hypothetical protein
MLPTKFRCIWPSGFRGEDFKKNWPIRNKNDRLTNMATTAILVSDWLISKKSSPLKKKITLAIIALRN